MLRRRRMAVRQMDMVASGASRLSVVDLLSRLTRAGWRAQPPADPERARAVATALALPEANLDFLRVADGGEGSLPRDYLRLWGVVDLERRQEDPVLDGSRHTRFGGNGGLEVYAFDRDGAVVAIDPVAYPEDVWAVASSFAAAIGWFLGDQPSGRRDKSAERRE